MKKGLLAAMLLMFAAVATYAQPRAIGGRLGNGIEVSYQHSMGEKNMIEIDLGMPWNIGIQAVATYDWIFPITAWTGKGTWNWYAGVGAGAGYLARYFYAGYNIWTGYHYVDAGFAGVAGHIGVEYNFESIPLNLAIDYRPVFGAAFCSSDYSPNAKFYAPGAYDFAISARYIF